MKRHGDDDYEENKRARHDMEGKTEIRLLISSKNAGGVIGKGGDNIKRLRSDYDANLTVPDSNSPERIITCIAEYGPALECIKEVIPKLDETKSDEEERDVKLLVHQSHAGAIIGRGGFKIKELRDKTGTNLKVYSQCCPMSSDRVLQITGDMEKIMEAIKEVLDMISELPIKGSTKNYDTINYDPTFVFEYGGHQPDKNWRGGPPPPRGGNWGPPRGPGYGPPGGRGPRSSGGYDRNVPIGMMDFGNGSRYGGGPGGGYGGGGGGYGAPPRGFGGGGGGGGGPPTQSQESQQVTIPSDLGGTIIGKNGERINRIREDSGAQIVVDPPPTDSDERIITITGTQNQIQMAQYLLQQCVAGRKYSNQTGPGGR